MLSTNDSNLPPSSRNMSTAKWLRGAADLTKALAAPKIEFYVRNRGPFIVVGSFVSYSRSHRQRAYQFNFSEGDKNESSMSIRHIEMKLWSGWRWRGCGHWLFRDWHFNVLSDIVKIALGNNQSILWAKSSIRVTLLIVSWWKVYRCIFDKRTHKCHLMGKN